MDKKKKKSEDIEPKTKSTVRNRKNAKVPVQQFMPIAEIRSDTVFLKHGGLRAIIEIEAINFNLKSETEQEGIIAGYGSFVNTLSFPLQIVIRSMKTNIDPYLENIRAIGKSNKNSLLRKQTTAYADFLEQILEVADIMQKRFYVIVPFDQSQRQKSRIEKLFSFLGSSTDSSALASQRSSEFRKYNTKLRERVELIETGLVNIGLHTHRLTTRELIELFYQIYNPQTCYSQKLPEDLELLNTKEDML